MADEPTLDEIEDWEGALGPQSNPEPMFYEIRIGDEEEYVALVGASPGMVNEYEIGEFKSLVAEGEWILAENDMENEVFRTPDGVPNRPY